MSVVFKQQDRVDKMELKVVRTSIWQDDGGQEMRLVGCVFAVELRRTCQICMNTRQILPFILAEKNKSVGLHTQPGIDPCYGFGSQKLAGVRTLKQGSSCATKQVRRTSCPRQSLGIFPCSYPLSLLGV